MKALVLVLSSIFFAPVAALAQPDGVISAQRKIKILSWNIYMLPGFLGTGKIPRAEAIGRLLASSDYDVIVFQEAFHSKARKTLSRLLSPAFPFQAGPANQKTLSLKINSGIWIFSKHPIDTSFAIVYKTRQGIDAFSRKGALLTEIRVDGQPIQVIGTHLQNAGGDWLRYSQCVELHNRLLLAHERLDVSQIVCGDFNINRHRSESGYQYMLEVLGAVDGVANGGNSFSYDRAVNDLTSEPGHQQDLIDYVLFRNSDHTATAGERRIRIFQHRWTKKHRDLSDHFAVEAEIPFPEAPRAIAATEIK